MEFSLSKDTEFLSKEILQKILDKSKETIARYEELGNYYVGKQKILSRVVQDKNKPNNKVAHPYANYITDTLCGYFVGEPITYSSAEEKVEQVLTPILTYNDVAAVDMELATDASIYGRAYELQYVDEDGLARFTTVSPQNMIIVYDDTIEKNILFAIRLIPTRNIINDKLYYVIEVYSSTDITTYEANDSLKIEKEFESVPHNFNDVPVVEYLNNKNGLGDFETIISLIDAYDALESDALNDFDYFVDCYLLLTGLNADSEDIAAMKQNRVILLDDADSKAEGLVKNSNDTVSENLKNRFKNDIHKFAKVPDLSDESFSNNASGVAIKYKLFGTETLVAKKERYFKKGLQRRLELIFNIENIKSLGGYDWRAVEITFTRNLPTNESETADIVQKLSGIVSTETLLSQIPFVENVSAEMDKIAEEREKQPFYNLAIETETEENTDEL